MSVSLQYGGILRQPNQKFSQGNKPSKAVASNINFGRALTSEERNISNILLERAFQINGVEVRAVVMPGASTAAYTMNHNGKEVKVNPGVGSPNSKAAKEQLELFRDIHGINARQGLPTGSLTPQDYKYADKAIFSETFENVCPFSGSPLEKGSQNIDPGALLLKGLVDEKDIEEFNASENPEFRNKADYDNYFAKEDTFFKKAHANFAEKVKTDADLKKGYDEFLAHPVYSQWVEKKATTAALIENLYGKNNFIKWNNSQKQNPNCTLEMNADLDKKLFLALGDVNHPEHKPATDRWNTIKQDPEIKKSMDFYKFKQFVAYDQNKDMYNFMQSRGLKEIADVPIGSSLLDVHAFPDAFDVDFNAKTSRGYSTLACPMGSDKPDEDWNLPALKKNPSAIEYTGLKYDNAIQTADTVRVDGAWQLRKSLIIHDYDDKQSKEWRDMGEGFLRKIKDVFEDKRNNKGKELQYIVAENQGDGDRISLTNETLDKLKFHTIEIRKEDSTSKNILSWGIHDHNSLASYTKGREDQINAFAKLYRGIFNFGNNGASQIQTTFLDLMGRKEQINDPFFSNDLKTMPANTPEQLELKKQKAKSSPNWKVRDSIDFEEQMFRNLAGDNDSKEKLGSNTYKALNRTFYWKKLVETQNGKIENRSGIKDAPIVAELLQYFEDVAEQKGVYTTKEANKQQDLHMANFERVFGHDARVSLQKGFKRLSNPNITNKEDKFQEVMLEVAQNVQKYRAALQKPASAASSVATAATDAAQNLTKTAAPVANKQIGLMMAASVLALGGLGAALSHKRRKADSPKVASGVAPDLTRLIRKGAPSSITGAANKKSVSHVA